MSLSTMACTVGEAPTCHEAIKTNEFDINALMRSWPIPKRFRIIYSELIGFADIIISSCYHYKLGNTFDGI
jgi:hypothetical protein